MDDYSLVPVDHQPDFDDVSLVPVDHDPFGTDGLIQQVGSQSATQPQQSGSRADLPDIDATKQSSANNKAVDTAKGDLSEAPQPGPSLVPSGSSPKSPSGQLYSMATHAQYSTCVDKCLHLLPSPSGDLQASEFHACVARCMGAL